MAKKRSKPGKLDPRLVLVGLISAMFATFGTMCIPCLAANPTIAIFFAFLGALLILLSRYSLVLLAIGLLLIATAVLLRIIPRKNRCE